MDCAFFFAVDYNLLGRKVGAFPLGVDHADVSPDEIFNLAEKQQC